MIAAGPEVPSDYLGRRVAVYRSLARGPATLGLWCDRAQVPYTACLRLPEGAEARSYGGSLVFIADTPDALEVVGRTAETLVTRAVFDRVGGEEVSRLLPTLPHGATLFAYGFLGGPARISFPTSLLMAKALTLNRFSNFETTTVRDPQLLDTALHTLEAQADHALFTPRIGRTFAFDQFDAAMAYEATPGAKAILAPCEATSRLSDQLAKTCLLNSTSTFWT